MAPRLSLKETHFWVRNVRTRMPFRYGSATLTAVPILHVAGQVEVEGCGRARGLAADILPPRWFDKDPTRDYARNVADLIAGARAAARIYADASSAGATLFGVWREAAAGCQEQGDGQGLNHLTSAHGSSLMERVLFDALGQATGRTYHQVLATNLAAVDLAALHPELSGMRPLDAIAWQPLAHIAVRHTVGLSDPIRTAEITAGQRLDDGLPQSLEEYLPAHGLRYLKIKVGGDHRADLERLRQIAAVLQAQGAEYAVTVDGNEQYTDMEGFHRLLHAMSTDPALRPLYARVLYIEQPLDRTCALDPEMAAGIRVAAEHRPLLIDESDGDLDAFRRAISLGYTGVSSKSCKGLLKALANQALARRLTGVGKGRYFLSGEDLMNLPVVPLHQDLTHLACLGVEHAERNGHHYVRGLDHLSPGERAGCLQRHPDLYEGTGDQAFLRVTDGRLCVGSLQCPGLGAALPLAEETMVPLAEWRFESLH